LKNQKGESMKNKIEHTPGPWRLTTDYEEKLYIKGSNSSAPLAVVVPLPRGVLCRLCGKKIHSHCISNEGEANARLIAAAPELLAALEEMEIMVQDRAYSQIVIDRTRAAIAKAKG
jgi:hypothetical protein